MPILPSSSSPLDSASQPTLSSAVESSRAVLAADRRRRTLRRRVLWAAIALALAAVVGRSILLARRPPRVEVETVVAQTAERTLAVLARVRPLLQNQILPLAGGRLLELPLEEGESFRRGALLASVDDIVKLKARKGVPVAGAVLGRALYNGAIDPAEALRVAA